MKRILTIALCLLLASCVTSKKSAESTSVHTADTTASSYQAHTSTEVFVTESTDENTTVVVTEITFYEQPQIVTDSAVSSQSGVFTITTNGEITGSANGIKSIKQTTIVSQSSQNSEIQENHVSDTTAIESHGAVADIEEETHTEKKTNSTRSTVILVASIFAVCLLYLKRKPIIDFIKKMMIGFVKTISRS